VHLLPGSIPITLIILKILGVFRNWSILSLEKVRS
jgi:hypothetical protein